MLRARRFQQGRCHRSETRAVSPRRRRRPILQTCTPARRVGPPGLRDFFGLVAERFEEGGLLLAGHDVDAFPTADFLAQLAADAGLLVDVDLAEVGCLVLL